MQKASILYLMTAVAIIAACLSFWQAPMQTATESPASSGVPYGHIVNLKPLGFYFAVSIVMHVCTTLLGIRASLRWLCSILLPTFALFCYHFVNAKQVNPLTTELSIDPQKILLVDLTAFTACFLVVSGFFNLFQRVVQNTGQPSG